MNSSLNSLERKERNRKIFFNTAFISCILALLLVIGGIFSQRHFLDLKEKQFAVVLKRVNLEKDSTAKLQISLGASQKSNEDLSSKFENLSIENTLLKKQLEETKMKLDMLLLESAPSSGLSSPSNKGARSTSEGTLNH